MSECFQFESLTTLEHGVQIASHYEDLISHLKEGISLRHEWTPLPEFLRNSWLIENQLPFDICQRYQKYHDCGKPFCLEVSEDGKRHFPNHAQISKKVWLECGGSEIEAELMGKDMDLHLIKAEETKTWASENRELGPTLLLTAWCEIHANAQMFGGLGSDSFKIKLKRLTSRAKAIMGVWC